MFQAAGEEHMQKLRGTCKVEFSVDDQGVQGRRGAEEKGPVEPWRPQEELWVDVQQEWGEVGGQGRDWVTWWPVLGVAMERQRT